MSLETRLSQLSTNPLIRDFATGVQVRSTRRVQKFLAPVVPAPDVTGRYKKHGRDSRTTLPNTLHTIGGHPTRVAMTYDDGQFICAIHALDYQLDAIFEQSFDILVPDALLFLSDIESQASEMEALSVAVKAAGAGTPTVWDADTDPVNVIDAAILALIKSAKCDGAGVAFDPVAWGYFKNHPLVIARCKGDVSFQSCPGLFHTNAEFMTVYAFYDANATGAAENIQFMMPAGSVFIFAKAQMISRADASWLHTFQIAPDAAKFRLTCSNDERTVQVQFDWAQVVLQTNTAGVTRLNPSLS